MRVPEHGRYPPPVTTVDLRTLRLRPGEVRRETLDVELEPFVLGGQRYEASPGHDAGRPRDRPGVGRDGLRHAPRRAPEWRVHALPRLRGARQHGLGPRVPRSRCARLGRAPLRLRRARPPPAQHVGTRRRCAGAPGSDLCRPDCAGLCPVCGKDLNVEPHEHLERDPDPRWAALEGFLQDQDVR